MNVKQRYSFRLYKGKENKSPINNNAQIMLIIKLNQVQE